MDKACRVLCLPPRVPLDRASVEARKRRKEGKVEKRRVLDEAKEAAEKEWQFQSRVWHCGHQGLQCTVDPFLAPGWVEGSSSCKNLGCAYIVDQITDDLQWLSTKGGRNLRQQTCEQSSGTGETPMQQLMLWQSGRQGWAQLCTWQEAGGRSSRAICAF